MNLNTQANSLNILFAKRLESSRKKIGMTQAQLAKEINCQQSQIATWESGQRMPKTDVISRLATILNADPKWLAGLTIDPEFQLQLHNRAVPFFDSHEDIINFALGEELSPIINTSVLENIPHVFLSSTRQIQDKKVFAMNVCDSSMEPLFCKDDIIIINTLQKPSPGATVFILNNEDNSLLIRKYREVRSNLSGEKLVELESLNEDWPVICVDAESKCCVIGTVIEHHRIL